MLTSTPRITSASTSGSSSGASTVGSLGTAAYTNGGTISGTTLTLGVAGTGGPGVITTTTQTIAGAKTLTGNTNINSLSLGALAVSNLTSGGAIGAAADTVDLYSAFQINQTTSGQTITLPTPTNNDKKIIVVSNVGTVPFTFYNRLLVIGRSISIAWDGTAWSIIYTPTYNRYIKPYHGAWTIATTSATPVAGRVYLEQFEIENPSKVDGIYIYNVATAAGSCIVGIVGPIVADDTAGTAPVVAQGTATVTGTNTAQLISLSTTPILVPGRYYACAEWSDVTCTFARHTNQQVVLGWTQRYDRGGGYGALTDPTPATTNDGSNMPMLTIRSINT